MVWNGMKRIEPVRPLFLFRAVLMLWCRKEMGKPPQQQQRLPRQKNE